MKTLYKDEVIYLGASSKYHIFRDRKFGDVHMFKNARVINRDTGKIVYYYESKKRRRENDNSVLRHLLGEETTKRVIK